MVMRLKRVALWLVVSAVMLVAFVTNSKSAQNPRYTAQAVSKPITVKYQLSIGANDCVATYGT